MPTPRPVRCSTLVALLAALSLTPACGLQDQPTAPAPTELPDRLEETLPHGSISISRTWEGPGAREALRVAEATHPDPDSILTTVERSGVPPANKDRMADMIREYRVTGPRWWLQAGDRVLVPYAITGAAVQHVLERTRVTAEEFEESGDYPAVRRRNDGTPDTVFVVHPEATMEYSAHAAFRPQAEVGGRSFEDVVVVQMTLTFSKYCGLLCGFSFGAERTVVVSDDGRVLVVEGDGGIFISMS